VQTIEERQGMGVGCVEAVAYSRGFINAEQLEKLAQPLLKSGYGIYLRSILNGRSK
jgi:glucose-1-phosphate thymidylyltransferase